jgi:hypothetical protein
MSFSIGYSASPSAHSRSSFLSHDDQTISMDEAYRRLGHKLSQRVTSGKQYRAMIVLDIGSHPQSAFSTNIRNAASITHPNEVSCVMCMYVCSPPFDLRPCLYMNGSVSTVTLTPQPPFAQWLTAVPLSFLQHHVHVLLYAFTFISRSILSSLPYESPPLARTFLLLRLITTDSNSIFTTHNTYRTFTSPHM